MSDVTAKSAAPLDEVMLAMDVVDTLRHNQDLVARELSESEREQALIDKLRAIYSEQGIDVPDHILKEGVSALGQTRFLYTPPPRSFGTTLARLYVARKRWLPALLTLVVVAGLGLGGYFLVYQPFQQAQLQAPFGQILQLRLGGGLGNLHGHTRVVLQITAQAVQQYARQRHRAGVAQAQAAAQALADFAGQAAGLVEIAKQGACTRQEGLAGGGELLNGALKPSVAVVRPDRIVMHSGAPDRANEVIRSSMSLLQR